MNKNRALTYCEAVYSTQKKARDEGIKTSGINLKKIMDGAARLFTVLLDDLKGCEEPEAVGDIFANLIAYCEKRGIELKECLVCTVQETNSEILD